MPKGAGGDSRGPGEGWCKRTERGVMPGRGKWGTGQSILWEEGCEGTVYIKLFKKQPINRDTESIYKVITHEPRDLFTYSPLDCNLLKTRECSCLG